MTPRTPADPSRRKLSAWATALCACASAAALLWSLQASAERSTRMELIENIIRMTKPLTHPRGERLPLILWGARAADADDAKLEQILRDLDARGVGLFSNLEKGKNADASLSLALRVGALQKKLGLRVNVFCNDPMYSFFNGDVKTAHVDDDGKPFFDDSFGSAKMGCPFALEFRCAPMKERIERIVNAYRQMNVPMDFVFSDWEVDGPIEWNGAWESSKRCKRCRRNIPDIDDFTAFQNALRTIRSQMQKRVYADTVLAAFPDAHVGNYAVYPHDGYRCWVDYFEHEDFSDEVPFKKDGRARYRPWAHEFDATGYTFAMPVVYTWARCYRWYDSEDTDWRWFRNMLLTATNACEHTPDDIPVIPFVHHKIIWVPGKASDDVTQFSTKKYKELLWHMLLRGTDGFALWCPDDETSFEVPPLQQVYAESLEYKDFLLRGEPVTFDVPGAPGPVVSGLRLDDRALLRRTDFTDAVDPVALSIGDVTVSVGRKEGVCQIVELK